MALEGCGICVRYLLIVWDFVVLLLGLTMLGMGMWLAVAKDSGTFVGSSITKDSTVVINYSKVSNSRMMTILAFVLVGLGIFIVVITVLAIVGAVRGNRHLLSISFTMQCTLLCILIGVGIYLYINRDSIDVDKEKLKPLLRESLREAVQNYHDDTASKMFMDAVQEKYKCCGADQGGREYAPAVSLPPCEPLYMDTPCLEPYFQEVAVSIGVKEFFSGKMTITMSVGLALVSVLIVAMILTIILCVSVEQEG